MRFAFIANGTEFGGDVMSEQPKTSLSLSCV